MFPKDRPSSRILLLALWVAGACLAAYASKTALLEGILFRKQFVREPIGRVRAWIETPADQPVLGWDSYCRTNDEWHSSQRWYTESGFLALEEKEIPEAGVVSTIFDLEGRVQLQSAFLESRTSPPWFGDARDQSKPTAPWLAAGLTAEEWWDRVRHFRCSRDTPAAERQRLVDEIESVFGAPARTGLSAQEGQRSKAVSMVGPDTVESPAGLNDLISSLVDWRSVPDHVIERSADALEFLDAEGVRKWLPAFLRWTLRFGAQSSSVASDEMTFALLPTGSESFGGEPSRFEQLISSLSHSERATTCRVLRFIAEVDAQWSFGRLAQQALSDFWGRFCEECP